MENTDALLGAFASGDAAPVGDQPPVPGIKRDQDSTDDFEHLERDRREATESPQRAASRAFLEGERAPLDQPAADLLADQLADKFTDSESDADTAGESPMHRPATQSPAPVDPTPVLAPAPVPEKLVVATPDSAFINKPLPEEPKPFSEPKPASVPDFIPPPVVESKPALISEPKPVPPVEPKSEPVRPEPPQPEPQRPAASAPPAPELEPARAPTAHIIEAEVIFCQMGLDAWFDPQRLHPEVESLIYWRDAARSGAALGAGLALLLALACCSVVSVSAYAALLVLSAAVAFRIYRNVMQAVQKTNEGHPFKWLLETDVSVPAERAQQLAAAATAHLNAATHELRRLFLVEDLVDSLKFGVLLWCLTYVGACFNGITLIILGWIALFTLPKAYEMNKAQVDANLELARAKINEISAKVRAAVPLGRKAESEKDK